jgi:ATP-dependent Lhr-like helicase
MAHDRLIAEIRAVYLADDVASYLDDKAEEAGPGRPSANCKLERRSLVAENRDVLLWRGS